MELATLVKPHLSHFGFWDVNLETLDFDRYADFVIIRVMERGSAEDMGEVSRYYGREKVIKALTMATSLLPAGIAAGKHFYNLKDTDFKCFTGKQFHQHFSMY